MFYQLNKGEDYDIDGVNLKNWLNIYKTNLTDLILEDTGEATITNLTDLCYQFGNLQNVDMSNFNTANVVECYRTFEKCYNLKNVTEINTLNCTNFRATFSECRNITTFPIKPRDFVSDSTFRYMYSNCRKITEDICDINVTNCNMSVIFNCVGSYNMYNINISNSDLQTAFNGMSNLTNISNATFDNCRNGVTFNSCLRLKDIHNVTMKNSSLVTGASITFASCSKLTNVDGLDLSNVKTADNLFYNCINLQNITNIVFNVNTRSLRNAFYNCTNLTYTTYAELANKLPSALNLQNKYLNNMGLSNMYFTTDQINILNRKGYLDAVPLNTSNWSTIYNLYYE